MLLIFVPCQLLAMENTQIVIDIKEQASDSPTPAQGITPTDIKQWVLKELDARDAKHTETAAKTAAELESHKKTTESAYNRAKLAILGTLVTTICGVTTTLVTYFATRNAHYGSN